MSYDLSNYVIRKRKVLDKKFQEITVIYFAHGPHLGTHFCVTFHKRSGVVYLRSRYKKSKRIKLSEYKKHVDFMKQELGLTNHKSF